MHEPIAYTYEGEIHCPACAEARFGRCPCGHIACDVIDAEGNTVGAVAPWEEHPDPINCGDCGEELA
jgi:hypothetical protein